MLYKLQRKTLIPVQIIGYFVTLLIGTSIILITVGLYNDLKPLLLSQSEVFKNNSAIISKKVSVFKTINKDKIYFAEDEISEMQEQSFIKEVSKFNFATFKIKAFSPKSKEVPVFYTDLFFESIPEKYLDIQPEDWKWSEDEDFIPIIIPEYYLKLYNFGFAESQNLPVISENTISQIQFDIEISGKGKSKEYKSRIVGFSSKINSILVPQEFLLWANKNYGDKKENKTSRLLIEFNDPTDEKILEFFNSNNYSINKDKLESSKLIFFFKLAFIFTFFIAFIIVILSISFIILSINLIIQKNKEMIINLYNIGYHYKKIALFYKFVIGLVTLVSVSLSVVLSFVVRNYYIDVIKTFFDFEVQKTSFVYLGIAFVLILLIVYNIIINNKIKRICKL